MADGIIQFIKLALDQASIKQLEKEAGESSQRIANKVASSLQGTGPEGQAILNYITKIRTTFEANLGKIRTAVADGLVDIPRAERQAEKLAAAFTTKLQAGIERLSKRSGMSAGAQLSTLSAAMPRPFELNMSPRVGTPTLGGSAAELARAGRLAGSAWAQNFAPIVHHVLTSDATWSTKTAAIMTLGVRVGDSWAKGIREGAKTVPSTLSAAVKYGTDQALISAHKFATGYGKDAEAIRSSVTSVGKAFEWLKSKIVLVNIPNAEPLSGMTRARIRKGSKTNIEADMKIGALEGQAQLAAVSLTRLGRVAQALGVNVAKASPQVQALITNLSKLGASGNAINKNMPFWANGINRYGSSLIGLVKSLGLVYSARQALEFLKSAVQAAGESEVAWMRLSTAVSNYGHSLSEVMPQLRPIFDQQAKLGITYTSSANALARLINITGNYSQSLRALPVVQDIVASGLMTMEQATKLVGRAMIGDLGGMSRYAIVLDKNRDAIDQLNKRFGGQQAARAQTLTGSLERVSTAWTEFKVAMGQALFAGAKDSNVLDRLIEGVKDLRGWVIQNSITFKALGITILAVFGAFTTAIFLFVNGVSTIFKATTSLGFGIVSLFKSIGPIAEHAADGFGLAWLKMLRAIAIEFDDLFGTRLAARGDAAIVKLTRSYMASRKKIKDNMADAATQTRELWTGPADENNRAPDQPVNLQVIRIRAREHATMMQDISTDRANILGNNSKDRERSLDHLAELEKQISARKLEEVDNAAELRTLGQEQAAIDKVREQLAKKLNTQKKEETEWNRRLTSLSQAARQEDDAEAMKAVLKLNKIHSDLLANKKHMNAESKEYGLNESRIERVEQAINGHLEKQDKIFHSHVKKLTDMVNLNVDREYASSEITRLIIKQNGLFDDAAKDLAKAKRNSDAYNDALYRMILAKEKIRSLEVAGHDEVANRDKLIEQYTKELRLADKREAAERNLINMQRTLNKLIITAPTQGLRDAAKTQSEHITTALDEKPIDIKDFGAQITSAKELTRHQQTRAAGVQMMLDVQKKIQEQLDKQKASEKEFPGDLDKQLLKQKEVLDLQGKMADLNEAIHKAGEPILNMWGSLKELLNNDLDKAFGNIADNMASQFTLAFEGIFRDSRNLAHALNSIPKGFAKAMLDEIGKMAQGKVRENLAWALEETAKGLGDIAFGNFAGAGAAFSSAAQHTAAAAAWGAISGGASSLGISAGDAYSNSTDFASGSRGNTVDKAQGRGDIYLTLDGIDPSNPRHQRLVGETSREYQERYGGRIILVSGSN